MIACSGEVYFGRISVLLGSVSRTDSCSPLIGFIHLEELPGYILRCRLRRSARHMKRA